MRSCTVVRLSLIEDRGNYVNSVPKDYYNRHDLRKLNKVLEDFTEGVL